MASDDDIPSYENKTIELSYFPDIHSIFETSSDPQELKYYWNAWRKKNQKWSLNNFLVMVNVIFGPRNGRTKFLHFCFSFKGITAYEFWMQDFNMTQMDAVMMQIQPFYLQLHGFIRHQLNKKYGDSIISTNGPIPDHLFQQVLAQAWTNGSVLEENLTHKNLPKYNEILTKHNYDTMKLFKMANKFYESMGFEAIPESYWGTRLKMKSDEDEGDCKATILAGSSNVYMQYCHKMDFRTFMQAHGYLAEIHVALEKPNLPAYYSDSYGMEYAIGEAVILSASTPKHLTDIGLLSDFEFTEELLMNRLMRLSIHTMLNIPHYWELMDKYVGVGPPGDRVNNTFDFPYLGLNENIQSRKFNSEILSYQFYAKLCSISGKYPKDHLQKCDFYGSNEAGDALKKMIKLGSSKPIEDVLAAILPEDPKLNAESLLEYYSLALNWLSVYNQKNNVNIGWIHSNRKIGSVKLP
ncbi:angiotensin-converting enzyme-like [Eupeodes corollae]|uniref:angiotensin-converting enzyme-like n=1 Tax=Eupeodes corollae TaxID=290404 RepID=UPI00248FEBD2|nr:angiotensin-converting enzyme-like [Eupeodes corollae]